MAVVTRGAAAGVQEYVDRVQKGEYETPGSEVCRAISERVDASSLRAYAALEVQLESTKEFQRAVLSLENAPVNCGGFVKPKYVVLDGLTPFEQMAALCNWVRGSGSSIHKSRSFAFHLPEGEIVPVWVKKPKKTIPSPMTIVLGHGSGNPSIRNPLYTRKKLHGPAGWDEEDPKRTEQRVFIEPLNGLEIHRQPHRIGALLLKANPYARGLLANSWRYRVYESKPKYANIASVELPNQKKWEVREVSRSAAGYNVVRMIEDRKLKSKNLLPFCLWEDYRDRYNDDAEPSVSPLSIVKALPAALKGNSDPLDQEISKLFATQLSLSSIPAVKALAANTLFPEGES